MVITDLKKRKLTVWNKAIIPEGHTEDSEYRLDPTETWIKWDDYGEAGEGSEYRWEIDHVYPESLAKEQGYDEDTYDDISNLRVMSYKNNQSKDNYYPTYKSAQRQIGGGKRGNVDEDGIFTVNKDQQAKVEKLFTNGIKTNNYKS